MEPEKVADTESKQKGAPKPKRKEPLWAERIGRVDPNIPPEERPHIYEELPLKDETGEELRQILKGFGYEEWVTFPNDDYPDPLPERLLRNHKAQRKYEIFCGGFLYFYDEELKKYPAKIVEEYPKKFSGEQFDGICQEKLERFFSKLEVYKKHKIFFDWGKDYVRIYINPKPGNPDPPSTPSPPPPETSA
jgi:hypothetical protein